MFPHNKKKRVFKNINNNNQKNQTKPPKPPAPQKNKTKNYKQLQSLNLNLLIFMCVKQAGTQILFWAYGTSWIAYSLFSRSFYSDLKCTENVLCPNIHFPTLTNPFTYLRASRKHSHL